MYITKGRKQHTGRGEGNKRVRNSRGSIKVKGGGEVSPQWSWPFPAARGEDPVRAHIHPAAWGESLAGADGYS